MPAAAISLRAIDPERYAIVNEEDGDVIEEIEESKAFYEVYDGAVYMFQVGTYLSVSSTLEVHIQLLGRNCVSCCVCRGTHRCVGG